MAANSTKYYSLDDLNPNGEAKILSYTDGSTNWGFAFETDSYNDYNEGFIYTESITPVPEPGTIALLGLGAIGFAVMRRRRK